MAGSLATGLVAALLLVVAPFVPAQESRITGAVLCGFALGWAMLAVLSVRFTDPPQRWAAAPALFMGVSGLLLVGFGSSVQAVLNRVWPPALLVLAIWMFVRVRRRLRSLEYWANTFTNLARSSPTQGAQALTRVTSKKDQGQMPVTMEGT